MLAKLTGSFELTEIGSDEIIEFEKDMVVEVVREVTFDGYPQYMIYSEELNESTVVYSGLLEFIQ
jgi:hypothetical protein